ncbi:MAG TPA: GNAT family N-acetyltransferase [Candidatus Edwardsbacteria bacterium]|nr:GNAT family N-acetyltransferase [Candidatus Edwardsbacteria bacterium]
MGEQNILIEPLGRANLGDLRSGDGCFTADRKLVVAAHDDAISYQVVTVPTFTKRYPPEPVDHSSYIDSNDKAIFIAYAGRCPAGQIRLCRYWNRYGYIEDVAVAAEFRRKGIGERLVRRAVEWAKARQLPGVMLETQNINVAACRLYQRCGFTLGGFDRFLYRGLDPGTEEIALYWYLTFEHQS